MPITLNRSAGGDVVSLPNEITTAIRDTVKLRPTNDPVTILSEVIETVAGKNPDIIVAAMENAGGPTPFIQALLAEVKRVKSNALNKKG